MEEQKLDTCPLLDRPCIQGECALYARLQGMTQLGGQKTLEVCAIPALVMLMNTLIQVTGAKTVNLPGLRRM